MAGEGEKDKKAVTVLLIYNYSGWKKFVTEDYVKMLRKKVRSFTFYSCVLLFVFTLSNHVIVAFVPIDH